MTEAILVGATIGLAALIVTEELQFTRVCRLCVCFWASLAYSIVCGDFWTIGLVNIAAHLSYLTLKEVAYVEKIADTFRCPPQIDPGIPARKPDGDGVPPTEEWLHP